MRIKIFSLLIMSILLLYNSISSAQAWPPRGLMCTGYRMRVIQDGADPDGWWENWESTNDVECNGSDTNVTTALPCAGIDNIYGGFETAIAEASNLEWWAQVLSSPGSKCGAGSCDMDTYQWNIGIFRAWMATDVEPSEPDKNFCPYQWPMDILVYFDWDIGYPFPEEERFELM